MFLFGFGIFAGMMLSIFLRCLWGLFRKDDNKGTDKNVLCGNTSGDNNNSSGIRVDRCNNRNNYGLSSETELIEDFIICDMLEIL